MRYRHRGLAITWIPLVLVLGCTDQAAKNRDEQPIGAHHEPANPTFDFSGIEHFWQIVEILQQDQEPTSAQWDSLLNTPGYQALTASEFEPDFFVENFRLAFKPSLADERQDAMTDPAQQRYLRHYVQAVQKKEALDGQQERLQRENILAGALEDTRRYLPAEIPPGDPPVAFVIFANDGRGYEPIVVDLLASVGRDFATFLAHESHHWYRNRMRAFSPDELDPGEDYLVGTLDQIQAEGIADQIDKAGWFDPERNDELPPARQSYATRYKEAVAQTPKLIADLDSLIRVMSVAPADERTGIGEAIADLVPMSGHPTGFYMARLIRNELGVDLLVEDIANPFVFFRRYDEAARCSETNAPTLSPETLAFLASLDDKYTGTSGP